MNITAFNPLLVTPDADAAIALFESMGFEHAHAKEGIDQGKVRSADMKHPNGFRVDVASAPVERDILSIRVNVDDAEAAVAELKARGFHPARDEFEVTPSSKSMLLFAPTGYPVNICEHLKG